MKLSDISEWISVKDRLFLTDSEMERETKGLPMQSIKNEDTEIHYKIKNGHFYIFDFKLKTGGER
jgi:hypothetical protein